MEKPNSLLLGAEPECAEDPQTHREDENAIIGNPEFVQTLEDRFFQEFYDHHQNYGRNYDEYQPAFQYGWEAASRPENRGKTFESLEEGLAAHWSEYNGTPRRDWAYMRNAVKKAYERRTLQLAALKK